MHTEVKLLRTLHARQRRYLYVKFNVKGKLLDIIERHREIIGAMFYKNGPEGRENEKLEAEKSEVRSKSVMK